VNQVNIACSLSIRLNHHLFDTLYHAVALHSGAMLITQAMLDADQVETNTCFPVLEGNEKAASSHITIWQ
jgi:hypothetical protein